MAAAKLLQYKMDTNKIPKRPAIEKAETTLAKGWYSCVDGEAAGFIR